VKWNENKNLFVFENCVYDLEKDAFVPSNPNDYINSSCGYKYDDTNTAEFERAKTKIKEFVDSILLETDREYVWTLLGSSVLQSNAEEKAYFLLGVGRNGKGTLIKPFKNSLGKYWGDLNMNYYTTHDKGADTPNQNLYNCRNSRVVSSVEVSDSDSQNRAVKFVSDKFKTISGNDTIYARELGTKNSAYFQAGKPFIQTNVMPVFTKLDTSLKERIVVINFPYTFISNPTEPNEKPIDMSLKAEFDKEIYKTAMISLLFDYYKKYKEYGLNIPDSVHSYTKTYFANESIKGWIEENLEPTTKGGMELKSILALYEEATDKKMTVKQLKNELEGFNFVVKKGDLGYVLKNWKEITREIDTTEEIDTENVEIIEE
jgi:putative DNA primase/helicase